MRHRPGCILISSVKCDWSVDRWRDFARVQLLHHGRILCSFFII